VLVYLGKEVVSLGSTPLLEDHHLIRCLWLLLQPICRLSVWLGEMLHVNQKF